MINLNGLPLKQGTEEVCVCVCVYKRRSGSEKLCIFFLFLFSLLRREGEGGVTTDVLPPWESCWFDGDSGAYHVARGANSKYYNTPRCSLQTPFLAPCQSISLFSPPWCRGDGAKTEPGPKRRIYCVCIPIITPTYIYMDIYVYESNAEVYKHPQTFNREPFSSTLQT